MFRFFKKKPKYKPENELEGVLLGIYQGLLEADKLDGIERHFRVTTAFAVSIKLMREHMPRVPIEDDGPAMTIVSAGAEGLGHPQVLADVEHCIQQARTCPQNLDAIVHVMWCLLAPNFVTEQTQKAESGQL